MKRIEQIMNQAEESVIEPSEKFSFNLNEVWRYRELFYFFTWRDVKVKYKQTALGIFWVLLQPILTVVIFSFFFGRALKVPSNGIPYPVFIFSGLVLWNFFSATINTAGNSMISNMPIINKIYFPRVIIPVSAMLSAAVDFLIAFVLFILMVIYYQVQVNWVQVLFCWPAAIVLLILGTLGISCWLAALNVKYRDIRYVIPFGLQALLFLSPVIYPASIVHNPWVNYGLALNPMYAVIGLFRYPIIGIATDPVLMALSVGSCFLFLVWGLYYFKHTEAFFADIS